MKYDIRDAIAYDPDTGVFHWKVSQRRLKAGSVAGTTTARGYRRIGYKGKQYQAHRLAFFMMKGFWPAKDVDHKNLDPLDNRWSNLRECTFAQNQANTAPRNSLGKGVTRHKGGKYQVQLKSAGRTHYLGLFVELSSAREAYAAAASKIHGEFARVSP